MSNPNSNQKQNANLVFSDYTSATILIKGSPWIRFNLPQDDN